MNVVLSHLLAFGAGVVLSIAVFIFLNRTKADQVDKVEGIVRKPLP